MGGSMTKVLPGLYIGANCISHILIVQNSKNDIERSLSRKYLQIIVNEKLENSLLKQIQLSNDFIHRARLDNGNILVCSDSGMSANVAVVTAYLMTIYSLDYYSAIGALRGLRFGAHPVEPLQRQLLEFDSISTDKDAKKCIKSDREQYQPLEYKTIYRFPTNLIITSGTERERLISIYGNWPCIEEDLQILHDALNSYLNSTEESEFLFSSYEKTEDEATKKAEKSLPESDLIITEPKVVANTEDGDNSNNTNDNTNIMSHASLSSPGLAAYDTNNTNVYSKDFEKSDSTPLVSVKEDIPAKKSLDSRTLATTPTNDAFGISDMIQENSSKSALNETDIFGVDPAQMSLIDSQLNENWDRTSQVSSSVDSENSVEIGLEAKDDIEDNVPGAIEIPSVGNSTTSSSNYEARSNRGAAHTYSHHYGLSDFNRSEHITTAHSLFPTHHNMMHQQMLPTNTSMWNPFNYAQSGSMQNFNLSSTAPTCDIFSNLMFPRLFPPSVFLSY
ncbi:unnamed protein product [Heterobilharzia americana]|nr:unnamed protein product [Heterobilharzia americana]